MGGLVAVMISPVAAAVDDLVDVRFGPLLDGLDVGLLVRRGLPTPSGPHCSSWAFGQRQVLVEDA